MRPVSRTVKLATGLQYHLLEWGAELPALDHTIVLVHGFLDSAWCWEHVVASGISERFHVIAPDMRGHGDSDRIGAGGYYHFADYIADLDSLIAIAGRNKISLVGHSMGGMITSYWAGTFPERLSGLAIVEGLGPPESIPTGPERIKRWLTGWRGATEKRQRSYPTVLAAAERLRSNDPMCSEAEALRLAERQTRQQSDDTFVFKHDPLHVTQGPYAFTREIASRFWREIRCPVLAIDGTESVSMVSADERQARLNEIPNVHELWIAQAGHMIVRHQPAALARAIVGFLE